MKEPSTARYVCAGCLKSSVLAVATRDRNRLYCVSCAQARQTGIRRARKAATVPQVAPMPAAPSAPPQVRVTHCPGYTRDVRFAVDEAPALFSGLGIGRYLA